MTNGFNLQAEYPKAVVLEYDCFSFDQWMGWWDANHTEWVSRANKVVAHTRRYGLLEPVTRRFFQPKQIEWNLDNLRESGLTEGISSRMRATLYAFHACLGTIHFPWRARINPNEPKIFAPEAVTDFALLMRGHFSRFLGSEYTSDPAMAKVLFPIPSEDLTGLSFEDGSFDVVITNEILEHVPSLDRALAEMVRVLKPGGWHVGTCPFRFLDRDSLVRTIVQDGRLVHVLEPEWHGDPMESDGSLVFEIPGWDILERAKAAGFSRAFWKFIQSPTFGIAGDFVLCLQK